MPEKPSSVPPTDTRGTDATRITRILAGDEGSARAFYDQHFDFVWSIVSRYGESADDAADIVQDAFVRIYATLDGFRGDASLRTWLFRVASASALDHVRRRHRQRRVAELWGRPAAAGQGTTPNDPYLRARIADAVATLSPPLRDVFLMFEVHGRGHEEIAESLGIPVGTSKSRLSAARDYLQKRLKGVWLEQQR